MYHNERFTNIVFCLWTVLQQLGHLSQSKKSPVTYTTVGVEVIVESWSWTVATWNGRTNGPIWESMFNCCVEGKLRKFYWCLNAILRVEGRSDDMITLQLLETHCISILTYGIEGFYISQRDKRRQLRVAYNSVFRRIFNYRRYESVRQLVFLRASHMGGAAW